MLLLPEISAWAPKTSVRLLPAATELAISVVPLAIDDLPRGPTAPVAIVPADRQSASRPDPVTTVYLLVAGAFFLRLLIGTVLAVRFRKRAKAEGRFLSSPDCACPVTIGWLHPAIVLPGSWREWPQRELHAVLAHESKHVRRHDPLLQWFSALNRCIFWFHPLAWWLERKLPELSEEACDAAVVAKGHDPHDYSEYLLHHARSIRDAGGRIPGAGVALCRGDLSSRIRRLLDPANRMPLSRSRSALTVVLCAVVLAACDLDRVQRAVPGQPSMNELMHKGAATRQQDSEKQKARMERARSLTPQQAKLLVDQLKRNPQDEEIYWTLVRHFEHRVDSKNLNALRLWYIEHHPGGTISPGNIDPRFDRASYQRGKSLWLAHIRRSGPAVSVYRRAADFLEGANRPLAEQVLEAGRKAHPGDPQWPFAFGRHYAQTLLGAAEPLTEYNVFRVRSEKQANSAYAVTVRARLAASTDSGMLAQTARHLLIWSRGSRQDDTQPGTIALARAYTERAASLDPDSRLARSVRMMLTEGESNRKGQELLRMSEVEKAGLKDADRLLLALTQLRMTSNSSSIAAIAREVLEISSRNRTHVLYGDAVFEANVALGKVALRSGDKESSARSLLAAAESPVTERKLLGSVEMNLPRALVDAGKRDAVAQFLERMAAQGVRSKEFTSWAAQIRRGINPDLSPTFTVPGCSQDPC